MEPTEKVAFLYLRFNGFFIMPHFTVFGNNDERHVDVLGFRVLGSKEQVGGNTLLTDDNFIDSLEGNAKDVCLWAEVGTGDRTDLFSPGKLGYVAKMFGDKELKKVYFRMDSLAK